MKKTRLLISIFLISIMMFISIPFNAVAMGNISGEFYVLGGVYETEN